jgi:uncharacterized membrane protein YjjP (DUF1212 family)
MAADSQQQTFSRRELNGIAKVVLKAARMLMENGAETRRVFETSREMGKRLGVPEIDILVTHRSVMVTVASGDEAVTRIARVGTLGVNQEKIMAISRTLREMPEGERDAAAWNWALDDIAAVPPNYPNWLILIMAGLACGGFGRILGCDWAAFLACSLAAVMGLYVRQKLVKLHFQPMLSVFSAAFVSASLATLMTRSLGSTAAGAGVAASVLYLVPGIPMINAVADLVKGHLMTGHARAMTVALAAIFVGSGLILAMKLWGFRY